MRSSPEPQTSAARRAAAWCERTALLFVHEPTLWPVLMVLIGHFAALVAPLLLLGLRDGHGGAQGAVAALGALTALGLRGELRRRGRPGALGALALGTWLLTGAAAFAADRYGIF
ncbi:MAG: hypothetical protein V3U03_14560 [Myxococcota bacterium]